MEYIIRRCDVIKNNIDYSKIKSAHIFMVGEECNKLKEKKGILIYPIFFNSFKTIERCEININYNCFCSIEDNSSFFVKVDILELFKKTENMEYFLYDLDEPTNMPEDIERLYEFPFIEVITDD